MVTVTELTEKKATREKVTVLGPATQGHSTNGIRYEGSASESDYILSQNWKRDTIESQ